MENVRPPNVIERFFKVRERNSTVRTELIAGLTTFVALSYIIFVNPNILMETGIPKESAIAATIWVTAISTLLMGVIANYPIALAPGMGLTAFFVYYVCGTIGLPWSAALGAVFCSGVVFLILTVGGIRQAIINSVPQNLKTAISVGLGLFIAFIGLKGAGIITLDLSTIVTLGDVTRPETVIAFLTLLLMNVLMSKEIPGAILLSIIIMTILSMLVGLAPVPQGISDIVSTRMPDMGATFGKLDIMAALDYGIVHIVFTFTIVELFDNMGTLIGLGSKAGLIKENGEIENIDKALTTDAFGTMISSVFGTSTVTSYLESALGIAAGGRTGLTAVTIAFLFIVAFLFTPLIAFVPSYVTSPALILVGCIMMAEVKKVNFDDLTEGLPAFMTIIIMPLTASIANGFALGFISYVIVKLLAGRVKEVNPVMWLVSIAFLINLISRSG